MARFALTTLERKGLVRRMRMLSKDKTVVRAVVLVFDNTFWNPDLTLKADNSVVKE